MKISTAAAILSVVIPFTLADHLPELINAAPTEKNVKERIAPPAGSKLFDVWYGKGNRIYQCNPEKSGFQHWYNVQTQAFLYPTKGEQAPFDKPGKEIGQIAAAPLNPDQQMSNPLDTTPVIFNYKDGSWVGSSRPLSTTTKEEGRKERGDDVHLDDHVSSASKSSTDGYLSYVKHIVRVGTLDGAVPPPEHCTQKGMVVNKPFSGYFMFYTDNDGFGNVTRYQAEWDRMVKEYTIEKFPENAKKRPEHHGNHDKPQGETHGEIKSVESTGFSNQVTEEKEVVEEHEVVEEREEVQEDEVVQEDETVENQTEEEEEHVIENNQSLESQQEMLD